jgi:hypothetical protein
MADRISERTGRPAAGPRRWLAATFDVAGPVPAGAQGRWPLVLAVREPLAAGAAIRITIPLGSTPPALEDGPGAIAWQASRRALVLAEIVRRRHVQLNVTGGVLRPGDTLVVTYGGAGGARIQPWLTDEAALFEVAVDPGGHGRFEVDDVAALPLRPGPPAHLHVVVPSVAAVGHPVRVRVVALDAFGNPCHDVEADVRLRPGVSGHLTLRDGRGELDLVIEAPGVHRLEAEAPGLGLAGRSNPCRVTASPGPRPLWGDPHVHTRISDGAGSPAFALRYARDVSLLDFTAITDHDIEHYHPWFLRSCQRLSDAEWAHLGEEIRAHREPGRFAVLRGYEWTGRPWGDKCVYFRSDAAALRRYEPGDADSAAALFRALRAGGPGVLAVPHTPASNFMGTDWAEHDPGIQRLVEVYSMHGCSEYHGCPREMIKTVPGQHVQDALARGYRLGLVAAGDTHSSQPGNPVLDFGPYRTLRHRAGITAVLAGEVSEAAIFDALHDRRTYATTGARILLDFSVNGAGMGREIRAAPGEPVTVRASVHGTGALAEVTIVRDGVAVFTGEPAPDEDLEIQWPDRTATRERPACYYLRVRQQSGDMAWSSPLWVS